MDVALIGGSVIVFGPFVLFAVLAFRLAFNEFGKEER